VTQTLLPATLTTSEFESAVQQLNPQIAVFDCDGTLWSGDAGSGFMHWSIQQGLLSRDAIDWLDARYRKYLAREVSELAICGEMVQVYQGLRDAELRRAAADFFTKRIEPGIFPEMRRVINALQSRNVEIWAVSSTNDWVIEEAMKRFDIPTHRVLAARVEIRDGIATNRLIDVPTDQGKVDALARAGVYVPGSKAPDAVFGNSVHDAAMLAIARRAFPVNPSPALVERSAHENWPVYFPKAAPSL
jgi:phosphoserine phosphatase